MIGQTQNAPINEKEEDTMNTFSQFFARPAKKESKSLFQSNLNFFRAKHDEETYTENEDETKSDKITSSVRARSPVLRAEMFEEPDLPGPDAVYINR